MTAELDLAGGRMYGWMDGWMDGWMGVKAVLRDCLAQSKKLVQKGSILNVIYQFDYVTIVPSRLESLIFD